MRAILCNESEAKKGYHIPALNLCSIMNLVTHPKCCKVATNILLKMVRHVEQGLIYDEYSDDTYVK